VPTRPPADPRAPADPEAVRERRARALEEPLDVRLRRRTPYPLLEVRNPIHGTVYLVMLPEFPAGSSALCTCTDFARRGLGTCKHIEAGLPWLRAHPEASPLIADRPERGGTVRIWKKIEAGLAAATRGPTLDARRWRRAGALLLNSPGYD
jgi:hypothetical protein